MLLGNSEIKSKYAIFVPCSANYLPGLNALLNGLDLYDNTADVWVIEDGIPEDYKKKAGAAFNFQVNFVPIKDCLEGEFCLDKTRFSAFYKYVFSPYVLQMRLRNEYKVVATIGADIMIVNNIMKWFEVAEKTGLIVTANNPYTLASFDEILPEHHFYKSGSHKGLITSCPISDTPAFMDPKLHEDVLLETIRMGNFTDANMEAFGTAIWNTKKTNELLLLDSELWTCGIFYSFKFEASNGAKNRKVYFANKERVFGIHKKYWLDGVIYQALYDKVPGTYLYENAYNNIFHWCRMYRELNTMHKLVYDYPENKVFDDLKSGKLKLKCDIAEESSKDK